MHSLDPYEGALTVVQAKHVPPEVVNPVKGRVELREIDREDGSDHSTVVRTAHHFHDRREDVNYIVPGPLPPLNWVDQWETQGIQIRNMPPHESFDTTHWSVILLARDRNSPEARAALGELCRAYWYPLYAFIRHHGHDHQTAEDLTQTFFTRLLESNDLARVDRSKGRFRAFLLAACKNFLANERDRRQAQKRGGDRVIFSINQADAQRCYDREPAHWLTAEALFARRWAILLLDQTIEDVRAEFIRTGQSERFEALKPTLTGDHLPYSELAARLNTTVGAVQVAVHRLRQQYRAALRARIGATVGDPSQIDEEIRELFAALAS